ncbi:hypothetical protein HOK00_07450 [bacterium]|nr:hypothetical protein [bacterium]
MKNKNHFSVGQEYEILPTKNKISYVITIDEWKNIKSKIKKIICKENWYIVIGSLFGGMCLSALVSILSLDFPSNISELNWHYIITSLVCIISFITGALLFFFGNKKNSHINYSKDNIIELMDSIESRYKEDNHETI